MEQPIGLQNRTWLRRLNTHNFLMINSWGEGGEKRSQNLSWELGSLLNQTLGVYAHKRDWEFLSQFIFLSSPGLMWGAGGAGVITATHLLCPLKVQNSDTMEVCLLSLTPLGGGRGQLGWVTIMILNKHIRTFIPKWSDLSQWAKHLRVHLWRMLPQLFVSDQTDKLST